MDARDGRLVNAVASVLQHLVGVLGDTFGERRGEVRVGLLAQLLLRPLPHELLTVHERVGLL